MKTMQVTSEGAVVLLTQDELVILNNAINETLNALEPWEFQTRVGAEREEAGALLRKIHELMSEMKQ